MQPNLQARMEMIGSDTSKGMLFSLQVAYFSHRQEGLKT